MQVALLADGKLHLQDGPIDLIIHADGASDQVRLAYRAATERFDGLLHALTRELPLLRRPVGDVRLAFNEPVARRMQEAVWPYRAVFITPMAAVAGSVAEAILEAMLEAADLRRAFVNNGGDIALHLAPGETMRIGMVHDLAAMVADGMIQLDQAMPVRGIATSGRHGRSFSRGIADAVSVLAQRAAEADAAATIIANAVDLDDAAITRVAAHSLDPDSDLGPLAVTVDVGPLTRAQVGLALDAGLGEAERLVKAGLIAGALLSLRGDWRTTSGLGRLFLTPANRQP
jgi:uncharacterized protein